MPVNARPSNDKFESLLHQGFELHKRQQYHLSIPALERARALRGTDYRVNLLLGVDYLRTERPAKAIEFLNAARSAQANDPVPLGYLAESYAALQQFDSAYQALSAAASLPGSSLPEQLDLVRFCLRRFGAVVEELRFTKAGLPYARRLQTGGETGNCAQNVPGFEQQRRDEQLRHEADYRLALCYARRAEEITGQMTRAGTQPSVAHVVRGEVLLRLARNGAAARAEYHEALRDSPQDASLWAALAEAELLAGNTEQARQAARTALQFDPHRIQAKRTFAEASIQQRDYAAAIPFLTRVLAAQPSDLGAKVLLGTAYAQTGEYSQALPHLEAALKDGYPDEQGATHYLLGTALRRLGRQQEADQALAQAQALSDAFAQTAHNPANSNP